MKLLAALALLLATTVQAQTTGDEWFASAASHLQKGEEPQAIAAYEKAWELGASSRMVAGYNLACLYARAGKADAAFAWLDKVKGMGFRPEQVASDTDLAPLKSDPRWAAFRKRVNYDG